MPRVVLPFAVPFTSQEMVAFPRPQKAAVKICVWPRATLADAGEMEFAVAQATVTVALADFEGSATLVAVTVTAAGEGTTNGAV